MSRLLNLLQSPPRSVEILPADTSLQNYPRRILQAVFASVPLQPLSGPLDVVDISLPALSLLAPTISKSLTRQELINDPAFRNALAGNASLNSRHPEILGWGHRYWGTQFGNYAGQLGDGAAALIAQGDQFEINLKGSGQTPFSRGFDGRKVLRSSIREYLCSEAMAGLEIPTTRAGSIIVSMSNTVIRDVNYTGRPIMEKCAVVARIAKTFLRFGSFETKDNSESETVKSLLRFSWKNHIKPLRSRNSDSFIEIVTDRTALMVAKWQAVGFTHGVMNTDNMSIIGDTIDYGPYGFIETFDPHFVPNTSDKFGRYAFSEQPRIAAWNCRRLQEHIFMHVAAFPLETRIEEFGMGEAIDVEAFFHSKYAEYYTGFMIQKMGVDKSRMQELEFTRLLSGLLNVFDATAVDYTVAFRAISNLSESNVHETAQRIMTTFPPSGRILKLTSVGLKVNRQELVEIDEFAHTRLGELERAGIDLSTLKRWRHKLDRIDKFQSDQYEVLKDTSTKMWIEWLEQLAPILTDESRNLMMRVNPIYIPRQHLMQQAIIEAENGNYAEVQKLTRVVSNPFMPQQCEERYELPDLNDFGVCLSCSS